MNAGQWGALGIFLVAGTIGVTVYVGLASVAGLLLKRAGDRAYRDRVRREYR